MRMTLVCLLLMMASSAALAQTAPAKGESEFEQKAESVLRQPLKDLGIMQEEAPAILLAARADPYGLSGLRQCRDLKRAIAELTEILGPDVNAVSEDGTPLPNRLVEEGARAAVGMLIPFRGLVREATGAAQTERELRRVLIAGTARRSFLKGYATARGCKV